MPAYRTYIIGRADHFWGAKDMECADDQEAIQRVQQTMDGRDVELWERGRFIVRLSLTKPGVGEGCTALASNW
jgi:hypothetical protein